MAEEQNVRTKKLYIMRHAKSSWDHPGLTDFQRPLNRRGLSDAPQMGDWMVSHDCVPDWVFSSTAIRARSTAELVTARFPNFSTDNLRLIDQLYHAPANVYLNLISQLNDNIHQSVMLIGHNPGLEDLVEELCGHYQVMSTAAIAVFDFCSDSWQQLARSGGELAAVWRPKEIFH